VAAQINTWNWIHRNWIVLKVFCRVMAWKLTKLLGEGSQPDLNNRKK